MNRLRRLAAGFYHGPGIFTSSVLATGCSLTGLTTGHHWLALPAALLMLVVPVQTVRHMPPPPPAVPPTEAPDQNTIDRLEWEQLGHAPADGSATAEDIARAFAAERLRATCPHEDVIDMAELGQAIPHGMCQACGQHLVMDDAQHWRPA